MNQTRKELSLCSVVLHFLCACSGPQRRPGLHRGFIWSRGQGVWEGGGAEDGFIGSSQGRGLEGKELIEFAPPSTQNVQPIKAGSWEGPSSLPPEAVCAPSPAGISTRYTSFQNVGLPGGMGSGLLDLHFLPVKEVVGVGCTRA